MKNGNIGVKTENIFPVIKKFLYSENEIFLREIISNAVDATQKLKTLASAGEYNGELGDLTVKVEVDKKKKTITVRDNGIGMTEEEVDNCVNNHDFPPAHRKNGDTAPSPSRSLLLIIKFPIFGLEHS